MLVAVVAVTVATVTATVVSPKMTIIVFLIDTSASMNQRAYLGGRPTLLDVAKSAVETFVKVRSGTAFVRRAALRRATPRHTAPSGVTVLVVVSCGMLRDGGRREKKREVQPSLSSSLSAFFSVSLVWGT